MGISISRVSHKKEKIDTELDESYTQVKQTASIEEILPGGCGATLINGDLNGEVYVSIDMYDKDRMLEFCETMRDEGYYLERTYNYKLQHEFIFVSHLGRRKIVFIEKVSSDIL